MTKSDTTSNSTSKAGKTTRKEPKALGSTKNEKKLTAKSAKTCGKIGGKASLSNSLHSQSMQPVIVKHEDEIPEGLPRKYFLKSTFNTQDIMHAPVEKTLKMLDKILAGERLFTM